MFNQFFRDKNGKPIFVTGLQAHNSSTGTPLIEKAILAVKKFHGNLLEAPVYWYQLEPEKGVYDTTHVRDLILKARENGLYLVILWFGNNKNGHPNYVPEYIKLDPQTYRLAETPDGLPLPASSPHCMATLEADKRAFAEVMRCIKEVDEDFGTVIAVQVENETGIGASDRDYSDIAEADYKKPVPAELDGIELKGSAASMKDNSWRGRFGMHANEAFCAWYHAKYVNAVAEAGKAVYDIPMYVNAALGLSFEEGGYSYNSGGPNVRVFDIWKKGAPSIDILSPDIYNQGKDDYSYYCDMYARDNNPLFIPESGFFGTSGAINPIRAVGQYGAIGVACFGAESAVDEQGELKEIVKESAITFKAIQNIAPLLIKYHNTGKIHAFVQDEFVTIQHLELPDYYIEAVYSKRFMIEEESQKKRGRGLLVQTGDYEFYLAGDNIALNFFKRPGPDDEETFFWTKNRQSTQLNFLTVEEGHFEDDKFVTDFYRNGDESNFELYARDGNMVRIRLNPMMGIKGKIRK